jgi:hypothetical protein
MAVSRLKGGKGGLLFWSVVMGCSSEDGTVDTFARKQKE